MSVFSKKYWIEKGYSEEESAYQIGIRRPTNILYWINKGYTEEEAKIKRLEYQKNSAKKSSERPKIEIRKTSKRCKEYWINLGYSEEEAILKVSQIQTTFSLEKCIEKYGKEDGLNKWKLRQEKWISTLNSKGEEEKALINSKKCSITYKNLKKKFLSDEDIKKYLLETRNIVVFTKLSDFEEDIKKKLIENPDLYYSPLEVCLKKFPKIQFDILGITDRHTFLKKFLYNDNDIIYVSNSGGAYRKWVEGKLLRSSYEIQFFDMLKKYNVEFDIDGRYPNSSMRYDFYINKNNHYIEIAPLYDKNEKYKLKMDKKKKLFNCFILKNYYDFENYLREFLYES
jgi:hypothetical protein